MTAIRLSRAVYSAVLGAWLLKYHQITTIVVANSTFVYGKAQIFSKGLPFARERVPFPTFSHPTGASVNKCLPETAGNVEDKPPARS